MGRPKYADGDFLDAALAIAAESGPPAVTVGAITGRLEAPVGSFYHRFASRDVLLGQLWLRTVLDFQQGITAALDAGDGLRAALHTPEWVRGNLDEARLLLLLPSRRFCAGRLAGSCAAWSRPRPSRWRPASRSRPAGLWAPRKGRNAPRPFLLAEMPVGTVRQHLRRREAPPPIVDELIRITYGAVVADCSTPAKTGVRENPSADLVAAHPILSTKPNTTAGKPSGTTKAGAA
jgi:AcrR family transcriptional regulator